MAVLEVIESQLREACFALRREVFMIEQAVPAPEEFDGLDDTARHYAVCEGGAVIATARLRMVDGKGKIERMAVHKDYRRRGYAKQLLVHMLNVLVQDGVSHAVLSAQVYAMPLYEGMGFKAYGDEFMDAGIPHRMMEKRL